jgi:transcription elongation factor S-II
MAPEFAMADLTEFRRLLKKSSLDELRVFLSNIKDFNMSDFNEMLELAGDDDVRAVITEKFNEAGKRSGASAGETPKKHYTGAGQGDRVIKSFLDAFRSNIEECDDERAVSKARQISDEIFKMHSSEQSRLIRSKCANLKDKDNPALCRRVYDGEISPAAFVRMSAEEMRSEALREEEVKILKDSLSRSQIPVVKAETKLFRCAKCGKDTCYYRQLQTRSADEPMTTFVYCECGHNWKFC